MSKRDYYYFMALLAGGALYLAARLLGSRVGRALAAIRSNESLAESSGISAYRHTMLACARRVLRALHQFFCRRSCSDFTTPSRSAVMVVAGCGAGPVGALVFTFVPELLRMAAFYRMLLYGVILLLVVMFMPKGLARCPVARGRARARRIPGGAMAALEVDGAGAARVSRSRCATSRCGSAASPPSRA